jgi:flavorubredoxin
MVVAPEFPRELADGIWWLGGCNETENFGTKLHVHTSPYLIVGTERAVLYDTGLPLHLESLLAQLDSILGQRPVDWFIPSHPEIAHSGSLQMIAERYADMVIGGDLRDYHLLYPDLTERFETMRPGHELDLGGGYRTVLLPALVKDLTNTVWAYERSQQVLFPSDGFAYTHHPPRETEDGDDLVYHLPGECALTSTELGATPSIDQAAFITKAALYWTKYVWFEPFFARVDELLDQFPAKIIAPAHGNPITDVAAIMPVIKEAHRQVYAPSAS